MRFGRKSILSVVAVLYMISAVSSALSPSYAFLVMSRMVGGLAFGASLVLAPMYIAEISPARQRGRLVSIQQLNIVLGFSTAYFSNYFLVSNLAEWPFLTELTVWRWMFFVEFVPATVFLLLLRRIPSSPRWLFLAGRVQEAFAALKRLYGEEQGGAILKEISQLVEKSHKAGRGRYRDLLQPLVRPVFILALVLGVLQQATGVNAIFFYAPTIFERAGMGVDASFAQAVLVGIINVVGTIVAISLIDRMGRRPLLLVGLFGVLISMGITSYGFNQATYVLGQESVSTFEAELNASEMARLTDLIGASFVSETAFRDAVAEAIGEETYDGLQIEILKAAITMPVRLILFGILGFVASFAISLGPVTWVILSEVFPQSVRAIGISVVGFVNSLVSWFVQFVFPLELDLLGSAGTFLIYGLFGLLGLVYLFLCLPETKGQSLEEIQDMMSSPLVSKFRR
jgi:MFS family permease